jgi:hypothetical protein
LLGAFQQERRQAGVSVPWRVPVVAQADQLYLRADEAAFAVVGDYQPGVAEDADRFTGGVPRGPVGAGEVSF